MIDTEYALSSSLAAALSAKQDRKRFQTYESEVYAVSPGLEIRKNVIDPSGGALYSGGSSYEAGLPFMASSAGLASFQEPLCQHNVLGSLANFKGNLAGFDNVSNLNIPVDVRAATKAAMLGGNAAVISANKLKTQAIQWAKIANERYTVVKTARDAYSRLKAQVDGLDRQVATLLATGKKAEAEKLRKDSVVKAKLALQYQKVNALTTELADNAMAQSNMLNEISAAVSSGKFYDIDRPYKMYLNFVASSDKAFNLRKQQIKGTGLQGLKKSFIDAFEEYIDIIASLRPIAKKINTIFNGYTIEPVTQAVVQTDNFFKPVGTALAGAATKVAITAKKALKKPAPPPKRLPPKKKTYTKRVAIKPTKINISQIARQGKAAATAAILANNMKGVTPEQLTQVAQQAEALVAGIAGAVSGAANILAQARQV